MWIDAHCDTLLSLTDTDARWETNTGHIDGARLRKRGPGIQWMAAYIDRAFYAPGKALARAKALLQTFDSIPCPKILYRDELSSLSGVACMATIEGAECLEDDLDSIDALFAMGVRALGLTWNDENSLSGGAHTPDVGLKPFGAQVIERCEQMGVLVDLAHISPRGFWDAMEVAKKPVIVSHTCCRALCDHPRNLTDEQIKAVAAKGGVVGLCVYPPFLKAEGTAVLSDVAAHMAHALSVGGADAVGLGTDFDGCSPLPGDLPGVEGIDALWPLLAARGVAERECDKVRGGSFARVLETLLPRREFVS